MEQTTFKILTLRNLQEHTEMLNDIMDKTGKGQASQALIKAGYEYLRVRQVYEEERRENMRLRQQIQNFEEGTRMFFRGLEKMKKATDQ